MDKKVLVVDDDPELGKLIETILKPIDISVVQAFSGTEGLKRAYELHPDLVILDVMMPGMDGFDVCRRLREMASVPILMLTARGNDADVLHGFNVGVDDFVRKPFNQKELEARVRALIRRSDHHSSAEKFITNFSDDVLNIDLEAKTAKVRGKAVELSPREFELLACLLRDQGKIISHRELLRMVWGDPYTNDVSMVTLYVHYLRKKLQDGRHGRQYIHTLWGRGYWFSPREDI